jgi:AcrR family transcriptional regulator
VTTYSGSGDPARSLALLWRTDERRSQAGLSVDRIARAAIALADADGLQALSMRRVADALGVGTMSLYTHVPGKAELLDVMLDMALGETERPEDSPGPWRARLEQVARENWALFRRHPWILQVATARPPLGPNLLAKYDYELRALDGIGLSDHEMDRALSLVLNFVAGAARWAVDAAGVASETGVTDAQWWDAYAPLLTRMVDFERYPLGSRVGSAAGEANQAASDPEGDFEFGIQRVLDGIEAYVATRAG